MIDTADHNSWRGRITVDGEKQELTCDPREFLSTVLRDHLGVMTVKVACAEGECGSCTVLLDGEAVDSCIYPVGLVGDRFIETARSTARDFDRLRIAMVDRGAVQCGFCTPGIVTAAAGLLRENQRPATDQIVEALSGNLCRCTGYATIVDAVLQAAWDETSDHYA